jgi:hypothetical protein
MPVMEEDITALREEIAALNKKVDELVQGHNSMSAYMFQFRKSFGHLFLFKWYRFIVWLIKMPMMPPYERKYIKHLPSSDRAPVRTPAGMK